MVACGRLAGLGEDVDFPFWDECFRLEQSEKGGEKTSKKSHFSWKNL
ncbi:hypothetical protein SY94_1633 [Agrobacterium tumefaciens]|nr:hypothetical protein SY94_1633 [Agrobacterium tumefaciens]